MPIEVSFPEMFKSAFNVTRESRSIVNVDCLAHLQMARMMVKEQAFGPGRKTRSNSIEMKTKLHFVIPLAV